MGPAGGAATAPRPWPPTLPLSPPAPRAAPGSAARRRRTRPPPRRGVGGGGGGGEGGEAELGGDAGEVVEAGRDEVGAAGGGVGLGGVYEGARGAKLMRSTSDETRTTPMAPRLLIGGGAKWRRSSSDTP
jgi:hypothetical protein